MIISNCVINLSGDKDRVIREAFRVLKPGGRFAVSDVVVRGEVPPEIRKSMELWVGCVAGALSDYDYVAKLARAGFEAIAIEATREYSLEDARTFRGRDHGRPPPRRGWIGGNERCPLRAIPLPAVVECGCEIGSADEHHRLARGVPR